MFENGCQLDVRCYMNLWGVAVLDSYPDHNKGTDHALCACPKTHPLHRALTLYYSR